MRVCTCRPEYCVAARAAGVWMRFARQSTGCNASSAHATLARLNGNTMASPAATDAHARLCCHGAPTAVTLSCELVRPRCRATRHHWCRHPHCNWCHTPATRSAWWHTKNGSFKRVHPQEAVGTAACATTNNLLHQHVSFGGNPNANNNNRGPGRSNRRFTHAPTAARRGAAIAITGITCSTTACWAP